MASPAASAVSADQINADPRVSLAVDALAPPQPPLPKDVQGSDNPVPLSPQWLLPKNGDNKLGIVTGESHFSTHSGSRPDVFKLSRNGEDFHDSERSKGALMPPLYDAESARHNRWRDEERETSSAIRRDRWREGDKEPWVDNSSRYSVDARRVPSDRWTDSGSRENNHDQRRESKWNTRWGPDDKESENRREKWTDYGKDNDGSRGAPQLINHGKDMSNLGKEDRDGDNYSRSWRSNSFLTRGRGEAPHNQSSTPNKPAPFFPHGRGRGENGPPIFSAGRGRVTSGTSTVNTGVSRSYSLGAVSDKSDAVHGDPSMRYSRMKLLDIYRVTDLNMHKVSLEGFVDIPSLIVAESCDPLALSAPTSEELVILKGIDQGDIVSSGLPQVSKDGSVGKNAIDSAMPKQNKLGTREEQVSFAGDYKGEHVDNTKAYRPEGFRLQRDAETERNSNTAIASSYYRDEPKLQSNENSYPELKLDFRNERHPSGFLDQPRDVNALYGQNEHFISREKPFPRKSQSYVSPEDLSLYYKDPNGQIQGPFSGGDMIGWYEAAYFGIDLQVRLANAPVDAPFSPLGDVMPHLRSKARPPPGFAKQNEAVEMSSKGSFDGLAPLGNINSEFEHIKSGHKHRHEAGTEAENRFIESLMSGNVNNIPSDRYSFLQGMQGYSSGGPSGMPLSGMEGASDLNYLLAQRLVLERQRSLPNSLPYWAGIDPSSMGSKAEINSQSPLPHPKFPPLGETPRQGPPLPTQNVDLLSILQAAAHKPSVPPNSTVPVWSNFPDTRPVNNSIYGGMDFMKDSIDVLRNQHNPLAGFGAQQHRLPEQNQASVSSGLIPPENLLSSEIAKDPQMLNLLQQQYLLSQLQLQTQAPVPNQVSLLDTILLRQQQEQQQQQLLMLKQQHLRQQILSVQQSHQHYSEPSYGHTDAAMPTGNAPVDHLGLQKLNEALQINQQMSNLNHTNAALPTGNAPVDHLGLQKLNEALQINQQMSNLNHTNAAMPTGNAPVDHLGLQKPNEALQINQQMSNLNHTNAAMPTGNAPVDHLGRQKLNEAHQINQQMTNANLYDRRILNQSNLNMQPQDIGSTVSSAPSPLPLPHEMLDHTSQSKESSGTPPQKVGSTQHSFALGHDALEKTAHDVLVPEKKMIDNCAAQPMHSDIIQTKEATGTTLPEAVDSSHMVSTIPVQVDTKLSSESISEECDVDGKTIKDTEVLEVRKSSEKKSRKQKKPKAQAVPDLHKVTTKTSPIPQQKQDSKTEVLNELYIDAQELHNGVSKQAQVSTSINLSWNEDEWTTEQRKVGKTEPDSQSAHRAWKPAPGLKPKSLVEIQQEEQVRAEIERVTCEAAVVIPTSISSTPWTDVVSSESRSAKDIVQGSGGTPSAMGNSEISLNSKSRKSQLHDLLAEEVLAKTNEGVIPDDTCLFWPPVSQIGAQVDISAGDDDDFVEAKDTKKGRKKAAKVRGAGLKASSPVASADFPPPVSTEKAKSTRQLQQEKELLPAPPSGPLLGDFVFWKGEQANAVPAPAWSVDSGKLQKPTPLRDILREQGRKTPSVQQQIPVPPAKTQSTPSVRGSDSSWQVPGSSPSKATSPVLTKTTPMQTSSLTASQSKSRIEDDLFWGPLDQSKPEMKHSEFPSLANPSGLVGKAASGKGAPGASSNRQKSSGSRPSEYVMSSPPSAGQSLTKGKRDATSRLSEAMDFRDWCEMEMLRLTGSNDTSFLEYCLKQSTAEAGMLLRENIGSLDRNHEFTDKFLNYKDFLSTDVIEIAFQPENRRKGSGDTLRYAGGDTGAVRDGDAGGGGKKKGKKGKKMVSPAVLGFNVVSNRIMMGEIQTVED